MGYWNFDEGSGGTANDASGNSNSGTWNGSGSHWGSGKLGPSAGQFASASSDWVNAGSQASLNVSQSVTMIAWVNRNSVAQSGSTFPAVLSKGNPDTDAHADYLLGCDANCALMYTTVRNTGGTAGSVSNIAIPTNTWAYFAGVYDGSNVTMYKDGSSVGSAPLTGSIQSSSGWRLQIGQYRGGRYFNGLIDDIRIYNRALSAAEIAAIYNATK